MSEAFIGARSQLLDQPITLGVTAQRSLWTSLGLYVFSWFCVFELVALGWGILFWTNVIPPNHQIVSPMALNLMGIVLGFIFGLWAQSWLRRFTERGDQYLVALQLVESTATHIADVLHPNGSGDEEAVDDQPLPHWGGRERHGKSRLIVVKNPKTMTIIHELRILLMVLARAITYLFLFDPHMATPQWHRLDALCLTPGLRAELMSRLNGHKSFDQQTLRFVELDVSKYLLSMLQGRLAMLCHIGAITKSERVSINEKGIARIWTHLDSVWRHRVLRGYEYYRYYIAVSLIIVFLAFPAFLWHPYGNLMFVIYPIMMFILSGGILVSRWLGDPFEGDTAYTRFDFELYHSDTRRNIKQAFDQHFDMMTPLLL
jgi:hypothetical protein